MYTRTPGYNVQDCKEIVKLKFGQCSHCIFALWEGTMYSKMSNSDTDKRTIAGRHATRPRRGQREAAGRAGHTLHDGAAHEAQEDRNHGQAAQRDQQGVGEMNDVW